MPNHTKARKDGLVLILFGSAMLTLLSCYLQGTTVYPMVDFRMMYDPARCLIAHGDPYSESDVLRTYLADGGDRRSDTERARQVVTRYVYLPTSFSFTALFALLPWGPAHTLWTALTLLSLILAALLVWERGAIHAPVISGLLIGFLVANSEVLVITGTVAGIAVSLCIVAVWCFLQEKFATAGILCLAVSLAIKPQDAGLVWLYFLLAGGVYRKRALQTLLATVALSIPPLLWVWHTAPNWIPELQSNMAAFFAHGGINSPGTASSGAHGLAMLVSMQAVFSFFWDDPRIYNPLTYLVCAPLLLVWAIVTMRSRMTLPKAWLALAAISALSMMPVYHRQYDTKLLLLTVPACVLLMAEGGRIGKLALLVNAAAFLLTADLPWVIILSLIGNLHAAGTGFAKQISDGLEILPTPLMLTLTAIFYLWVYVRRSFVDTLPRTGSSRI